MDDRTARKQIIRQARRLSQMIPETHYVYIHWKNDEPIVLPQKTPGYDMINTMTLANILNRQLILVN